MSLSGIYAVQLSMIERVTELEWFVAAYSRTLILLEVGRTEIEAPEKGVF